MLTYADALIDKRKADREQQNIFSWDAWFMQASSNMPHHAAVHFKASYTSSLRPHTLVISGASYTMQASSNMSHDADVHLVIETHY